MARTGLQPFRSKPLSTFDYYERGDDAPGLAPFIGPEPSAAHVAAEGHVLILALAALCVLVAASFTIARRSNHSLTERIAGAQILLDRRFPGSIGARAAQAIEALMDRIDTDGNRIGQTHSVTGLPTREPLFARMTGDGQGMLLLLACRDYDRLCAFDPLLADRVLVRIVDRLGAMLPAGRFLAHVDRSHLAIWIGPDVTPSAATTEAEALVYALGDRLVDGEHEILPEIVARHARFDADGVSPQAILSQTLSSFSVPLVADVHRNVATFDLGAHARERFAVEQDLRQAVARGELRMQFQPLIDAAASRVCGAEALLRWHHPTRGLVPPGRFIPIMEAAGLSQEIGLWALNHALREARNWAASDTDGLRVAVNLSGQQLDADDLLLLIERTLARHSVAPSLLEIELTESVALADGDRAARLCQALRDRGIAIAIDDFGTGYSSFSALRALPFDKIKIDRAFVTDIDTRRDNQAICAAILALGRGLGIRVLAEGVETAREYAWLRAHGCRYFQGYYFARPLDGDAFLDFVGNPSALSRLVSPIDPVPISERLSA